MCFGNVLILGDSYSTFKGYIPEGYDSYYSAEGSEGTDVGKVEDTWWYQLLKETDSNLVLNNSWSGSTIGYTGYGGVDCSRTSSFIYRVKELIRTGFFKENKIDTVFVFGGTNDNWCDAPLGTMMYENWEDSDLYRVLPAFGYFFQLLKETVPEATILCLINTELKEEVSEGLKMVSEKNGITYVQFQDIDKQSGHPGVKGMKQIKEQIMETVF